MSDAGPPHLQQQPSWSQAAHRPPEGTWCRACLGRCWWTERHKPRGCMACHPPDHLAPDQIDVVG